MKSIFTIMVGAMLGPVVEVVDSWLFRRLQIEPHGPGLAMLMGLDGALIFLIASACWKKS